MENGDRDPTEAASLWIKLEENLDEQSFDTKNQRNYWTDLWVIGLIIKLTEQI